MANTPILVFGSFSFYSEVDLFENPDDVPQMDYPQASLFAKDELYIAKRKFDSRRFSYKIAMRNTVPNNLAVSFPNLDARVGSLMSSLSVDAWQKLYPYPLRKYDANWFWWARGSAKIGWSGQKPRDENEVLLALDFITRTPYGNYYVEENFSGTKSTGQTLGYNNSHGLVFSLPGGLTTAYGITIARASGTVTNPSLSDGVRTIGYTGTVGANTVCIYPDGTANYGGVAANACSHLITGDVPHIEPGDKSSSGGWVFTCTGGGSALITVYYSARRL